MLGVEPKIAEQDACLIEHDISSETMEKLALFMQKHEKKN
jgi:Mn-dependent DtxR family transcriptional regulator